MRRIKALLTDLDGTLYRNARFEAEVRRLTLEIVAEVLGVSVAKAEERLKEARRVCATMTMSLDYLGVPRELFYEELSRRIKYGELLSPDPRIAQLLSEVRRRGYRVAIITNSGRTHALRTMGALSIPLSVVDALVTSSDVSRPKIDPEPYLKGLRLLGVEASEAVYMGDRVEGEVKPAKELGMITVLVSPQPVESPWVDFVIDEPFKILGVLEKLSGGGGP
ncbi:MAG: HAD family hydrolase [Candidatus Nezhaarchaeota archaeon]|nr:HAD family hydrolase [Candidatus Nezhaarchaeota archaeon]